MDFALGMTSLGIFRSITDCIKDLSLSALKNMLLEDDMVCIMVYLIESSPWIRKRNNESFEKFEGHQWIHLAEEDLIIVTTLEAQVYLITFKADNPGLAFPHESFIRARGKIDLIYRC